MSCVCSGDALEFVQNDTLPETPVVWDSVDVTGFSFELHVNKTVPLVKTGVLVDGPNGKFKFTYNTGDWDEVGTFEGEIQITDTGGKIITFQGLKVIVRPEIA